MADPGTVQSQLPLGDDWIARKFADIERDIRELGPSIARSFGTTIATLTSLVSGLTAQVAAAISANSLTTAQINSIVASPGAIAPTTVTASGAVSGSTVTGGDVFAQSLATNITASRVTLWGRTSDGYIATASSSQRYKTNESLANLDVSKILALPLRHYQYIAEVERAAADPAYHASLELGLFAEDLHAAGLWEFVVYQRDDNGHALRDADGNVIPEGIHYQLLALALLPVAQSQQAQIDSLVKRLSAAGIA
jgi:hypothetical protein